MFVKDLKPGKAILRGWVRNIRSSGGIVFILLRDGTGEVQVVGKRDRLTNFEEVEKLGLESSIIVEGEVVEDSRAPGGFEVRAERIEIAGKSEDYPISKKEHGVEFLLDVRHLSIRSPRYSAIWRVKDTILRATREFFHSRGFIEVTPPIIVSSACEGGSTLFEMKYFDRKAYLSQSAQLYLEALIFSYPRVFSITPSFRAEKSRTSRHLAEYWHIEPEMAWFSHEDNMKLQEDLIRHILQRVADEREKELRMFGRNPDDLRIGEFRRMTYTEAVEWLQGKGFDIEWGEDLGTEAEKKLTENLKVPMIVEKYPKQVKAFYMKVDDSDPRTVLNNDMLAPEGYGEIIGGSEREDRHDVLLRRMKEEGLDPDDYGWYLDLRKYGSVPHSGFGLGLERLVRWVLRLDHIRDAIPFPRTMTRSYP